MGKKQHRERSRSRHHKKVHKYHNSNDSTSRHRKSGKHHKHRREYREPSSSSSPSMSSSSASSSAQRRHRTEHFAYQETEKLGDKYRITKLLGDGTFGRVLECSYKGERYAVKVIKPVQKYMDSAKTERKIIKDINRRDPDDEHGIVRYVESFYHEDYYCLVFEPLGKSLFEVLKMNKFKGFPLRMVQSFFKQILKSLKFLHKIGYTHTDLKPQNILLQRRSLIQFGPGEFRSPYTYFLPKSSRIRIIDFGGATQHHDYHSSIINTRQYRSPEVILQSCRWNEKSDVWSIGCIICELYSGDLLFGTHSDEEHLAMMERCCGRFPNWMVAKMKNLPLKHMFQDGSINYDHVDRPENVIGMKLLEDIVPPSENELIDLLSKCLQISPNNRINCKDALKHPFFDIEYS